MPAIDGLDPQFTRLGKRLMRELEQARAALERVRKLAHGPADSLDHVDGLCRNLTEIRRALAGGEDTP